MPTICRHCRAEISPVEVSDPIDPDRAPSIEWSDGHPRMPFYCPKALNLNHIPEEG